MNQFRVLFHTHVCPDCGSDDISEAEVETGDGITEIAQGAPGGKEATRVFDHAKSFYRAAVKAYPDELRRFRELALAANDAVRGLER